MRRAGGTIGSGGHRGLVAAPLILLGHAALGAVREALVRHPRLRAPGISLAIVSAVPLLLVVLAAGGWETRAVLATVGLSQLAFAAAFAAVIEAARPPSGGPSSGRRWGRREKLSDDGGATWRPAELRTPLSDWTWSLWATTWRLRGDARSVLAVRAVDGAGTLQSPTVLPPFPAGASGYHRILLTVEGSRP